MGRNLILTQNEPTHQNAWCCGKLGVMDVGSYGCCASPGGKGRQVEGDEIAKMTMGAGCHSTDVSWPACAL